MRVAWPVLAVTSWLAGPGWSVSTPAHAQTAQAPTAAAAPQADAASYEALSQEAQPATDVAKLMAPFLETCEADKRELDRVRCRAARELLRKTLPNRRFKVIVADPAAIDVTAYDARIKGFRMTVAGCIACTESLATDPGGERRFFTTGVPTKDAPSPAAGVEVGRSTLSFESIPEAKEWLKNVRPHLRAELVFQPADTSWSLGASKGYAFKLLGFRAYDACSGDVLMSQPPSTGRADKMADDRACPKAGEGDGQSRGEQGGQTAAGSDGGKAKAVETMEDEGLPTLLTKDQISKALSRIRGQIYACYQQFEMAGKATIAFEVAGNGMVQKVKVTGGFEGSPTGECILEAAKNARFPRFRADRQSFDYPFFLR